MNENKVKIGWHILITSFNRGELQQSSNVKHDIEPVHERTD